MSDNNETIPPLNRKSGEFQKMSLGDHNADVVAKKAAKAVEAPYRTIVNDVFVKLVGVALLWWAYVHFEVAIIKDGKLYIGVCVGVAVLGLSCLIPTQTRALLAWAGERIPGLKAKETTP